MQKIGSDVRVREFNEDFAGSVRQCQLPIRVITSGVILQWATNSFNQLDGLVACVEFRIVICVHAGWMTKSVIKTCIQSGISRTKCYRQDPESPYENVIRRNTHLNIPLEKKEYFASNLDAVRHHKSLNTQSIGPKFGVALTHCQQQSTQGNCFCLLTPRKANEKLDDMV